MFEVIVFGAMHNYANSYGVLQYEKKKKKRRKIGTYKHPAISRSAQIAPIVLIAS